MLKLTLLLLVGVAAVAQQSADAERDRNTQRSFVGTWKGVCADGKDFIIVTLVQTEAGNLEGSIRLANMRGGDDGHCQTVVDPPSDEHALKVTDARLQGSTLAFKGSKRMEFEMTTQGTQDARLKFLGTASEDNPWPLKRTK